MAASDDKIKHQCDFCHELSDRLAEDVCRYSSKSYFDGHTRIQSDIKRLRRELLKLDKMFDWSWSD